MRPWSSYEQSEQVFIGSTGEQKVDQRAEHFFATISKWPSGTCCSQDDIGSVKLLKWGLERLKKNLDKLGYDATNLLSIMTLDVENLHSVHHKSEVSTAYKIASQMPKPDSW